MTKLPLTIATTDYDHFRDIRTGAVPPEGVFYNRMSASSHTRGHRHAPEHADAHSGAGWRERRKS